MGLLLVQIAIVIVLVVIFVFLFWQLWCVFAIKLVNPILGGLGSSKVSDRICRSRPDWLAQSHNWAKNIKPYEPPNVQIDVNVLSSFIQLLLVLGLIVGLLLLGLSIYLLAKQLWNTLSKRSALKPDDRAKTQEAATSPSEDASNSPQDSDAAIQESVAKILREKGAIHAGKQLALALHNEKNRQVRLAIINGLIPVANQLTKSGGFYKKRIVKNYIVRELKNKLYAANREEREAAVLALFWIGTRDALKAVEASPNFALPPRPITKFDEDIQFSVYYPPKVRMNSWYTIYLYVYKLNYLSNVIRNAREESGGEILRRRDLSHAYRIAHNTVITVVPQCDGVHFDSASYEVNWDGEWARFVIRFEPKAHYANKPLLINISILAGVIVIANTTFKIDMINQVAENSAVAAAPTNPLASAKLLECDTVLPYQKIFVSYSRKDVEIIDLYKLSQEALGNDLFIDTDAIRSGENWRAALAHAIDRADVFQLFWSENSAKSPNVRDEWDYALKYRCPQTLCAGFIRPVYWIKPMPADPPDELKHLNFVYVDFRSKICKAS